MVCPVQVVLNSGNFVRIADVNPGGANKDFYAGKDEAFLLHKSKLCEQVKNISNHVINMADNDIFYAHVQLQNEAWAKSHRPVKKIFSQSVSGNVVGAGLGELAVELDKNALSKIYDEINKAENETNWVYNEKKRKKEAKPTRTRSEVGAIKSIRIYSASDRRKFSIQKALEWLSDPRSGNIYFIDTFIDIDSIDKRGNRGSIAKGIIAHRNFVTGMSSLNIPIDFYRLPDKWNAKSVYIVKIKDEKSSLEEKIKFHQKLLDFLDENSIVKSVILPPILQTSREVESKGESVSIPKPENPIESYPSVGIVDTGVHDLTCLQAWSVGDVDMGFPAEQDYSHGTFIAGLISAGSALNSNRFLEEKSCSFYDLGLHPTINGKYAKYYPNGFVDFLDQLDAEIPLAKDKGVRIFNMSLAVTTPVEDDSYSIFANMLDEISDRHDVIFVLPAGNLDHKISRNEWPSDKTKAAELLATYAYQGQDRIYQPADSIRSIVVGALNPPDSNGICYPARYTRRGPGPAHGSKPDLCHIGGHFAEKSGLVSVGCDGVGVESCGTSYASPLVAKSIAVMDHMTNGSLSREALIALMIHHAEAPKIAVPAALKKVIKDFIGSGIPVTADQALNKKENSITLVFSNKLMKGQELSFDFAWPKALVNSSGGCFGSVKMTLVHRPPVDRTFGGEFVRVNLDAYLRQECIDKNTGEIKYKGLALDSNISSSYEKELVTNGLKWWPVKNFSKNMDGKGDSSQWRIVVDSLTRQDQIFPEEGIDFSVVLTISSTDKEAIFNDMRKQLTDSGVKIQDINIPVANRFRNSG